MNNSFVPYSLFAPISRALHLKKISKNFCAILCNLSLVLNIFLPYLAAIPAYAEEPTPTPIVESTPTPFDSPEPTAPAVTVTPTAEPTVEPTITPTITDIPTQTPSDNINQSSDSNSLQSATSSPAPATETPTPIVTVTPSSSPTSIPVSGQIETAVVSNNSCRTDLLNPLISSDKADYSPSEIAIITGSGFAVNTAYLLVVTAEGQPSQTYNIVSDSTGNFTYSYRLYDTYIPNYKVELKDVSGAVLASTSFTDTDNKTITPNTVTVSADWPNCGFQCTAGDVDITELWLAIDTAGTRLTKDACSSASSVPVYIVGSFRNNSNSDRYAIDLLARISIGGTIAKDFYLNNPAGTCSLDALLGKETLVGSVYGPFNWVCGQSVEVKDIILSYDPPSGGNSCANATLDCSARGTSKCWKTDTLYVSAPLITDFSAPPVCLGTPTQYTNSTTGGIKPYSYSWDFTNNGSVDSTTENPSFQFPTAGNFTTLLSVTDSDNPTTTNFKTHTATVYPKPTVDFSASVSSCPSMTVGFTNASSVGTYLWNFGDGTTSIATSPSHSYSTPGNYDVTLSATNSDNCSDQKTKTITVDPCKASLIVVKHVENNNGGTKTSSDFTLSLGNTSFQGSEIGTSFDLVAGTYSVGETLLPGYSQTGNTCTGVVLAAGATATCTITNDDNVPSLTLIKTVSNENGGTAVAADWTLTATGPSTISGNGSVSSDTTFKAGTYTLSESGPSSYTPGNWSCVGGIQNGNQITVALGQSATCTIINDDNAPSLILNKIVINDNGGKALESDWTLTANGGTAGILSGVGASGNTDVVSGVNFKAGTYDLSESSGPSGYSSSSWICVKNSTAPFSTSSITLALGDIATCTITNDDIAPKLTLVKEVNNDNGGNAQSNDFKLTVGGTQVSSGVKNTYSANIPYAINETQIAGYAFTSITGDTKCPTSLGSTITLAPGDDITCTIKNDDNESSITLNKIVNNNYGGTAGINDFGLSIGGTAVNSGQKLVLDSNHDYAVNEVGLTGYQFVDITGDSKCPSVLDGSISLATGENITCTITNRDVQPKLTLTKTVINNNGGNKQISDFPLFVNQVGVTSGVQHGFNAGVYTASETSQGGYTASVWGGDCAANGSITLHVGDIKSCTITNDDQAATLLVTKTVINNNGGTKLASDFIINVGGTSVSPSTFPGAVGTTVTLSAGPYSVSEIGISGYQKTLDSNCSGTITNGETKSCTITNDDIAPSLTLNKIVVNDNGGTASPTSWLLTATGPTSISGAGGTASGSTFSAGTYALSESIGPSGYSSSSWSCIKNGGQPFSTSAIDLNLGDIATCTVTNNDIPAHLIVIKHVVNDNGGTKVAGDFSTTITGVATSNPTAAGVESTGVDNILTSVGSYSVDEGAHDGYSKSLSADCTGTIILGETKTCTITNDDIAPTLTVIKTIINDNGGTSSIDDFDIKLNNVALSFTEGISGVFTAAPTVQSNLLYTLTETDLPGYAEDAWTCTETNNPTHAISHPFTLTEGQNVTCTITNDDIYGKINVIKFNDLDGDGVMNNNDVGLSAWTINLSGETNVTDNNGQTTFNQLTPDTYYLSETLQAGWTQTNIYCDQEEEVLTKVPDTILNKIVKTVNAQVAGYPVRVGESQTVNCYIGNRFLPPSATISKSNDATGDLSPGDSVNFKIIVIISGNDINDFKVTDLPSSGFTYRPGSYSVLKNGGTYPITEPVYHSPGLWNLGNLKVGDTLVLTYTADISSDQQAGKYTDLAWGMGPAAYGDNALVYAVGISSPYVNDNFVGTEVPIVKSTQNTISAGVEKKGEVLGASTELPSTGSNTIWLLVSALMSILGLAFLKKSSKKLIAIIVFAIFCLFPANAQAVSNLSIRLEQPKSPTNLNDLKLTFVALDINNNPITVKCFKKSPSDGSYSQFGSNISLGAPGNTSQCQADSSILNNEGTYLFYVSANDTVNSNIVSVDYKTSGPGTPSDYRKEWLNGGCDYKIHFRTADDGGKTVKVELYRADITNFILDAGSRVASVNIGSNQDYDITNSVPVCSKSYYYVLRAFDDVGNGSGTIGDSVTVTTTTTVGTSTVSGTTSGAIPVIGINLPSGTTEENIGETPTGGTEPGQILGTQNVTPTFLKKYWLPLVLTLLIIAGIISYVFSQKRKNSR